MKKFIQKLPLVALILGLSVFVANAVTNSKEAKTTTTKMTDVQWIYNPPSGDNDPTNPDYYDYHSASDLETACQGSNEVCGVSAPSTTPNPSLGKPDLSGLESDLEDGSENADIFRGDFTR